MHDSVPTMNIWTANGVVTINESDFDASVHTRAADDGSGPASGEQVRLNLETTVAPVAVETTVAPVAAVTGAPGGTEGTNEAKVAAALFVTKTGKKFFVVDVDGGKVEREGIDADGYGKEADAWAAIMALAPTA